MQLTSGYEARKARIEMVPLLDVVFLLLIFFIYAMMSMTVHHGLRVSLPGASGTPEPRAGNVVITVSADNSIAVENQPCSMDEAVGIAVALSKDGWSGQVLISGDRDAGLGIAMELLSRLRAGGVEKVSFLVKKPKRAGGNTE